MANAGQAPDLKGIHCTMHGIVEQIKIIYEINAYLVQHLAINNPPLSPHPSLKMMVDLAILTTRATRFVESSKCESGTLCEEPSMPVYKSTL